MAVTCLQREEKSLILQAEEELDGTHAYGPVDYTISLESMVICVTEVK